MNLKNDEGKENIEDCFYPGKPIHELYDLPPFDVLNILSITSKIWEIWYNEKGDLIYSNLACERIAGYTRDEIYKKPKLIFRLIQPGYFYFLKKNLRKTLKELVETEMEIQIHNFNNYNIWVQVSLKPLNNKQGIYKGILVSIIDITRTKEIQLSFHRTFKVHKLYAELTNDFFSLADFDIHIQDAMTQMSECFGAERVYVVFNEKDDLSGVMGYYYFNNQNFNLKEKEFIIFYNTNPSILKNLKDDQFLHISSVTNDLPQDLFLFCELRKIKTLVMAPLFLEGKWAGLLGFEHCTKEYSWISAELESIKLISQILSQALERKKYHEQLVRSEKKFRNLFNYSGDAVIIISFKGKIIEVNQTACDLLEYSRDEFLHLSPSDLTHVAYNSQTEKLFKVYNQSQQLLFGAELLSKSGRVIPVETRDRVVDYDGQKVIMVILRDVSDRQNAERHIVNTIIETEDRERKRFAEDLHDNVGPLLSAIKLYSQMIQTNNNEIEEKKQLFTLIDSLIDEAISRSRQISNNLMPALLADFGLNNAIQSFCNTLNKTKKVSIRFVGNQYIVKCNEQVEKIIFSVVHELLHNTLKHSGAKQVQIELKNNPVAVLLKYSDDGIGFNYDMIMIQKDLGLGLKSIIGKVHSLHGECRFFKFEPHGIQVEIEIPNVENTLT